MVDMQAQTVFKVDISEFNRNNKEEIQEPGFTLWQPVQKDFNEMTLAMDDGVVFTLQSEHNMRSGWGKVFVQSKEFNARLTGDGVNFDPNECGSFDLVIKGLQPGQHTIQTIHNSWADPTKTAVWPITLSVNGEVRHQAVPRTAQVSSLQDACVLTTTFVVNSPDEEVRISIATSDDNPPANVNERTVCDRTPLLNGFLIDAISTSAQAKRPNPAHQDMHVDADDGSYRITWSAANADVVRHHFYLGTDSAQVADMTTATYTGSDTAYVATGLRNLDTYYWRVDEETADGTITHGDVWYFRPRHLAFPGAEGYGRYANGGRGGVVYHVTNLSDDGQPGSFRYGMETLKGKRTIVFDVSGIITLRTTLRAGDANATIAGQTAPGKGICFRGAAMGFGSDQIIRHIRNRVGSGPTADGMGFRSAREAIMDHCSISWSIDEGFSSREAGNITLQRTLISEALNVADHDKYDEGSAHGFAAVYGGDIGSFHHNLLANNSGRNPRLDGGMDGSGYYMGRLDIFNNVVYNWNAHPAYGESHEANFHRNFYKMGPATTRKWILRADVNQRGSNKGTESYYYMYNVLVDKTGKAIFDGTKHGNGTNTNVDGGMWQLVNEMPVDWNPWVDEPFFPSYATVETANEAFQSVLCDVGCLQPMQDGHDKRQIQETLTGKATYTGSISKHPGIPDTEEDVGGYEIYPEDTRPDGWDTDQDGMPDWWEKLVGSDSTTANNNDDPDGDGYTRLEDYLNWLAEPHFFLEAGKEQPIDLKPYFAGMKNLEVSDNGPYPDNGFTWHYEGTILYVKDGFGQQLNTIHIKGTDTLTGYTYVRKFNFACTPDVTAISQHLSPNTYHPIVRREFFTLDGRQVSRMQSHETYVMRTTDADGRQQSVKIIKD